MARKGILFQIYYLTLMSFHTVADFHDCILYLEIEVKLVARYAAVCYERLFDF